MLNRRVAEIVLAKAEIGRWSPSCGAASDYNVGSIFSRFDNFSDITDSLLEIIGVLKACFVYRIQQKPAIVVAAEPLLKLLICARLTKSQLEGIRYIFEAEKKGCLSLGP